ncbi:hypothetical protein LTR70_009184 [Exophiala xenobiotica]|uniref:NmrA-like domain-containing protein n=1 Tax=Lithohypha guttulata TaxID=1690604 RepID=A0ABR0JYE1_9EURO|nr:hypothetical protein LTR24_008963 [Lithohypha guttulata]KAK5310857.1 hypothetical protein LTR70_009184 [Exophiala xenobiotica]
MASQTSVIIVGAAGNIGSCITHHLLASGSNQFKVSALTRASSRSVFPEGVTPIRTDYTPASLVAAFTSQDIVISTISTSSLGDQMAIAKAAIQAGVKRFLPAELGMDTSSDHCLQIAPCTFLKKDIIKYLQQNEDKISWTGVFCGLWIDFSLTNPDWPWWDIKNKSFTVFDDGNTPFETSTIDNAARAVVSTVLPEHFDRTRNEFIHVHSAVYTPNQLLRYLKKYTNTTDADWKIKHEKIGEMAARGQKAFQEEATSGAPPEVFTKSQKFQGAIINMISAGLMGNGCVNQFGEKTGYWMERFGLKEEDPEQIVRDVVVGA